MPHTLGQGDGPGVELSGFGMASAVAKIRTLAALKIKTEDAVIGIVGEDCCFMIRLCKKRLLQ